MQSFEVGKTYYFRCLVWNWIGKVKAVTPTDILLEPGAACVFDEGRRYNEFLRQGPNTNSEIELAVGHTIIPRSGTEGTEWSLAIPTESI